jgi:hypothetical protein
MVGYRSARGNENVHERLYRPNGRGKSGEIEEAKPKRSLYMDIQPSRSKAVSAVTVCDLHLGNLF